MKLDWDKIRNLLLKTKDLQQIAVGNISGKVIIAIFWLYMAAVLGTEDYGQVNYLIALGAMGAGLSMVGTTNTVSTNLTVKSSESAVIGGVLQNTSNTQYDKNDPDAVEAAPSEDGSQSSSLFNILRSKSYTTKKSQFVVFVTPEILESASKGTEEIRKKFKKRER